jgi:hypothetical protein
MERRSGKEQEILELGRTAGSLAGELESLREKEAMETAGVNFRYQSIYEITYNCLARLLEC